MVQNFLSYIKGTNRVIRSFDEKEKLQFHTNLVFPHW